MKNRRMWIKNISKASEVYKHIEVRKKGEKNPLETRQRKCDVKSSKLAEKTLSLERIY